MKSFLLNALPGALIPADGALLSITPLQGRDLQDLARAVAKGEVLSAVGHADTAALIGGLLGAPVSMARVSVPPMTAGTRHFVALYQGPRLPEGATTLPAGASVAFYRLSALCPSCQAVDPEHPSESCCAACRAYSQSQADEMTLAAQGDW